MKSKVKYFRNFIVKIFHFIKLIYRKSLEDDVPALGAQVTYYLILAIFPFLIFLLAVLSHTPFTSKDLLDGLSRLLPTLAYNLLKDIIHQTAEVKAKTLPTFSILITIWASSNGVLAFIKSVNKAYGQKESRSFLRIRSLSIIFTIAITLALILSFFMLVLGEMLWIFAFNCFKLPSVLKNSWDIVRHLIPLFMLFTVFVAAYTFIPNHLVKFKNAIPGALFSTFGLVFISLVFSFYVNNFGLYMGIYGSITGIIILLIWLYLSSIIIIIGSEINAIISYNKS
jgi:membrane protein